MKLGTGGLSRAYRQSAAETLQLAQIEDRYLYDEVRVIVPFDALNNVYRLIAPPDAVLKRESFGERNEFVFDVRASMAEKFRKRLTELRLVEG